MTDDPTTNFFLESDSEQLRKIHQWARARYAAPWAVFFAVLLRVAASVGPHVRLPGVIGGHASLNMLVAFVSPSGGGKGISDKVGRLAWPTPIVELPIGTGEGIAETFTMRGKEDEDSERIASAIFNCSEIDILTGLESRQGSTILGTLKAFAMGEQLGSTNASKANSRNVPAHSYRGCLSVGAQPGHTGVIFNDVTGGTPQRFLWAMTIDPDMPAEVTPDPTPLDTTLPGWATSQGGVVEIIYGHEEITAAIISAHLARQRGEADALDGHAMLTRCKVAAVLAIMHQRSVVSERDWQLSEVVMAVSDRTRGWLVEQARQAAQAKLRDRAVARAYGENIVADSKVERAARGILAKVKNASEPLSAGEIRRSLRSDLRPEFAPALDLLSSRQEVRVLVDGHVVHVDTLSTRQNPSSAHVDTGVHVDSQTAHGEGKTRSSTTPDHSDHDPREDAVKQPRPTVCEVCYVSLPTAATRPRCDEHDGDELQPPPPPKQLGPALRVVHSGATGHFPPPDWDGLTDLPPSNSKPRERKSS